MTPKLASLARAAMDYDRGHADLIQHFLKVHNLCCIIARGEALQEDALETLEAAALLHDIGIPLSMEKYHSDAGHYQEVEGPPVARALLEKNGGFTPDQIYRVCWLVGHHHTYQPIDGMDHQILIEADFLVNLYECGEKYWNFLREKPDLFRTQTGILLLDTMFDRTI